MPTPAPSPVPEGMSTITPHLWFNGDCAEAVAFYQKAMDAQLIGEIVPGPEGGVWHVMMSIGDSKIMGADHEGPTNVDPRTTRPSGSSSTSTTVTRGSIGPSMRAAR